MKELLIKIKDTIVAFLKKFGKYIVIGIAFFLAIIFGGKIDDLFRKHDDKKKQELKDAVKDAKEKTENIKNDVNEAKDTIQNIKEDIQHNINSVKEEEAEYTEKQKAAAEAAGFKKKE